MTGFADLRSVLQPAEEDSVLASEDIKGVQTARSAAQVASSVSEIRTRDFAAVKKDMEF